MKNSQENACAVVTFYLINSYNPFLEEPFPERKDSDTGVFWWISEIIKTLFFQVFTAPVLRKNILRKNSKEPSEKSKNLQAFISFYNSNIYVFFLSLLPRIHSKLLLLETMQFHWGFIYYRKFFLTFGCLTLISVNAKIFAKQIINAWNMKIGSILKTQSH